MHRDSEVSYELTKCECDQFIPVICKHKFKWQVQFRAVLDQVSVHLRVQESDNTTTKQKVHSEGNKNHLVKREKGLLHRNRNSRIASL